MHPYIAELKPKYNDVINHLKEELSAMRTGRANPSMVENVKVKAYDSTMKVKELASIKTEDSKTLIVDPFDDNVLQAIEKGIHESDIGLNPSVDGKIIRLNVPQMTEENRKEIVKTMRERLEDAKIKIRKIREESRDEVNKKEKDGDISEDEKYKILDEIDTVTREYTDKIDGIGDEKEEEIMKV
jgi:ribosome recycling factor